MSKLDLENLVRIGQLKVEAFSPTEFETYLRSAAERLDDAAVPGISLASKFLLAYGAAYTFSLAALRRSGYRPANRYVVFQSLAHTLDADAALWRTLARAHDVRNGFEYDGSDEVTEDLAEQVIRYANQLKSML